MKISGNEIKYGMLIEHKNDLWEILKTQLLFLGGKKLDVLMWL